MVDNDKLLLILEAQSGWTVNILIRILLYLAQSYHEYFERTIDCADIDIEIKAKVIYESDKDNIINEYIIFCKVFNEQIKKYGMTKQAVTETIRICKDRNILKQYLSSKEVEVITIMMSLFDEEQIMRTYAKDIARETAERMIKDGEMSLEKIAHYIPTLSMEELKEIEAEVAQLA